MVQTGLTVETETVEQFQYAELDHYAGLLLCDGEHVWYKHDPSAKIAVENVRTALDAIESGADSVDVDGQTIRHRSTDNSKQAVYIGYSNGQRATYIEDVRALINKAEDEAE